MGQIGPIRGRACHPKWGQPTWGQAAHLGGQPTWGAAAQGVAPQVGPSPGSTSPSPWPINRGGSPPLIHPFAHWFSLLSSSCVLSRKFGNGIRVTRASTIRTPLCCWTRSGSSSSAALLDQSPEDVRITVRV